MLEHFGFPCELPDYTPHMQCPRCGEDLFIGDEVFRCDMDNDIIGCTHCINFSEVREDDK
jgi:uncharacterized Zn finger protein